MKYVAFVGLKALFYPSIPSWIIFQIISFSSTIPICDIEEIKTVFEEYNEFLKKISTDTHLERKANEAENLNKSLTFKPLGWKII